MSRNRTRALSGARLTLGRGHVRSASLYAHPITRTLPKSSWRRSRTSHVYAFPGRTRSHRPGVTTASPITPAQSPTFGFDLGCCTRSDRQQRRRCRRSRYATAVQGHAGSRRSALRPVAPAQTGNKNTLARASVLSGPTNPHRLPSGIQLGRALVSHLHRPPILPHTPRSASVTGPLSKSRSASSFGIQDSTTCGVQRLGIVIELPGTCCSSLRGG